MSNNEIPNDIFGIEAAFKQIADAWNDSIGQAKLQSECKMRRFQLASHGNVKILGVVFPGGSVVTQSMLDKSLSIFNSVVDVEKRYLDKIQWIDAEPEPMK